MGIKKELREIKWETLSKLNELSYKTETRFEQIDKRFEQIDKRLDRIDTRLDNIEKGKASSKLVWGLTGLILAFMGLLHTGIIK